MKKLYGVIGNPIAHSMSPAIHNDAFEALSIDSYYHAFNIAPEDLKVAVEGMKVIGIMGFNVTIPHKTAIIPYLDEVDKLATAIGAVNTVVRKEDKWVGHNTDGPGFIIGLKNAWKQNLHNEKVLMIGAGGAAKAIFYSLAAEGVKEIDICNRTVTKAQKLIDHCPFDCQGNAFTLEEAAHKLADYTLIIQTTSIGMSPYLENMPISLKHLQRNTFVTDIIYNPLETAFLREARKKGAKTQNGLDMFVYQAALAFEKWTGFKPQTERMKKIVITHLGGNHVNR